MPKRTYLIASVTCVMLMAANAAGAAGWMGLRSGDLLIAGQVPEAELRDIGGRLERFRTALASLSPRLRGEASHPVNVIVFPDDASFSNFGLKRTDGTFDDAVAGYFIRGEDANFIAISAKGRTSDAYHTIHHEYVHNLLRSREDREIPAWLNEGLAQYLQTAEFTADGEVMLGLAPRGRLELLRQSELMPIEKLLSITNKEVHSLGTPRTLFYGQSWLLVHFLLSKGPATTFKERLERLYELSTDHAQIQRMITEQRPDSPAESRLGAYAASAPAPNKYDAVSVASPQLEGTPEDITPAAADALLGELLLRMGRPAEAEALIRKALALDKSSPRANSSLAEILMASGRYTEARSFLEEAERAGELGPLAFFNLAYSLVKETEDKDRRIGVLPAATTERVRRYLRRSIDLRPAFVEPYKLLGHVSLINNDLLREASVFLATAIALRPGDAELQLMLARAYLRMERYRDAAAIAAALATGPADASVKKDALEIQHASSEYLRASLEISTGGARSISQNLLFLKRSWLTDQDLKQIDLNRELVNLNMFLDPPRPGEVQVVGTLDKVSCSDGAIAYTLTSNGAPLKLWGSKFDDLRLSVLVRGMHSFKFDCGARFAGQKSVLLYKPANSAKGVDRPELTSVTFVPENFQLIDVNDLAAARTVVVEDDMLRRDRQRDAVFGYSRISDAERYASIKASLRKPSAAERQIIARRVSVDCSNGTVLIKAGTAISEWLFTAPSLSDVPISWFSTKALNFRLACGTSPAAGNALLTYKASDAAGPKELTAIEFIPDDVSISAISP